jgi:hypothetical protein
MAKKKKRHYSRRGKVSLAVVGGLAPGIIGTFNAFSQGGSTVGVQYMKSAYIGLGPDNRFHPNLMWAGTWPIAAGALVHKLANKLGVNRAIAGTGIPFVRI